MLRRTLALATRVVLILTLTPTPTVGNLVLPHYSIVNLPFPCIINAL